MIPGATFALLTVQLLAITGLSIVGGVLFLWICWKLWQELHVSEAEAKARDSAEPGIHVNPPLGSAVMQILIADLSMSLDNVVAAAGVADGNSVLDRVPPVIGLTISIVFTMFFSGWIANIFEKHRWIGYPGLAVIFYISLQLICNGTFEMLSLISGST